MEVFQQLEIEYMKVTQEKDNNQLSKRHIELQNEWSAKLTDNQERLKEYKSIYEDKLKSLKSDVQVELATIMKEYNETKNF